MILQPASLSRTDKILGGYVRLFLQIELAVTLVLDVINELLFSMGVTFPFGQVVRGVFFILNIFIALCCLEKEKAEYLILSLVFFVFLIVREISLGIDGMAYAGLYWVKVYSFLLTFVAFVSASRRGLLSPDNLTRFFEKAIVFLPVSYLLLCALGIMGRNDIYSGMTGYFLSKNALSAVLLMLLSISMGRAIESPGKIIWTLLIMAALSMLGSKAVFFFALLIFIFSLLHHREGLALSKLLFLSLAILGTIVVTGILSDQISAVVDAQALRYKIITVKQGGSIIDYLLSGRNDLLQSGIKAFLDDLTPVSLFIGSGVSHIAAGVSADILGANGFRGIEMDFFELFLAAGILGVCVCFYPIVRSVKSLKKTKSTVMYGYKLALVISVLFSVLGGHVFTEGMSGSYLGLIAAAAVLEQSLNNNHKKKNDPFNPMRTC